MRLKYIGGICHRELLLTKGKIYDVITGRYEYKELLIMDDSGKKIWIFLPEINNLFEIV